MTTTAAPLPPEPDEQVIHQRDYQVTSYRVGPDRLRIRGMVHDQKPPGVYIEVSNYGIGIEPDEERFIFEPYYRTRQAKTVAQGAGLGLTIASQIMAQHGGHLKLIRRTDPTIFQIFFPQSLMCQNRSEKGGR